MPSGPAERDVAPSVSMGTIVTESHEIFQKTVQANHPGNVRLDTRRIPTDFFLGLPVEPHRSAARLPREARSGALGPVTSGR